MPGKQAPKAAKVATIVGRGSTFTGSVASKGAIRIEGEVHGDVACEDTVVVHDGATIRANVNARQVIVSGEVRGNVNARDRIEITASGRVWGDLSAPKVVIAEGVVFEGRCNMA